MAGNLIYITDAGRAALVAPGNTGTTAHQVTQIGLATAAFVFKPDMTALPSELKRITTFGGDTVAKDTIHIVIQDDSADQYKLYGFGLYLDNGVLFGVYVQNDPILEKAATSMLLLAADTVFASIDVTKLVFGPTSFLNPPATTERKGVVELATQAEVDDGADDTRAVTPKTAASRYAALTGARFTGNISAAGGIASTGLDSGGANFRLMNGRDVILRNDGSNFYLLLTDSSGIAASWNSYRPVTVNMKTGAVMLDDTGAGTYVGGQLAVKGMLNVSNGANEARMLLGPSGGYFFGTGNAAGFYLPSTGAMFAFDFAKKNLTIVGNEVWNTGNLPNPAQTTGITMSGQILAAEGTVTRPGYSFVNDGAPDTGFFHIADGVFAVANNARETMRFLSGGAANRVLIGSPSDDGQSLLQIGGNAATRGVHWFGTGPIVTWSNSDAGWGYFRSNGSLSIGSENTNGALQLIAGNAEIARLYPGGRMTIGGTTDDGVNVAQVAGSMRAANYFINGQGAGDSGLIGINKGSNGPNIAFYGSTTAGGGALTFSAGGTERARVTPSGKFVVGATSEDGSSAVVQAKGPIKAASGVGALVASNGGGTDQTSIMLRREGGPADQKQWEIMHDSVGSFGIRTVNDAYSSAQNAVLISRGPGSSVGNMSLMPSGGRVLIGGAVDDGSILNAEGLVRGRGYAVDGGASWATIYFKNGAKTRFAIGKTDTDDFAVTAWADDGTTQTKVLDVARGTQVVSFAKRPTWAAGAVPFDTGNFDPNTKFNKTGDTATGDIRVKQPNNTDARGFVLARADGTAQAWFHGTMNGGYSAWC
ncbi:hypothetical protein [Burkholderia glumae]|uniref:phage tail fiber protein n=1 Tax=Burkholderia glumae TaxID=337 RepID=UPI003B9964B2